MIWHIVRKDLRLLWLFAAGIAAVNLLNAALLMNGGAFARASGNEAGQVSVVSNVALPAIGLLGLVLLVISVIQLDRLPGSSQEWLTRPIPRATLFTAKLVFVVVAGLLPMFVGDVAMGLAAHFDVSAVLVASVSRSVALLWLICVPAALVAVVTATLSEALVFIVGLVVILIAELVTSIELKLFEPGWPAGYGWIAIWIVGLVNLGLLVLALPVQLRWRTNNRLRWILLVVFSLEPLIGVMPLSVATGIQHVVGPSVRAPVSVEADRARTLAFRNPAKEVRGQGISNTLFTVPVTIVGAQETDRVFLDRAVLRLVPPAGVDPGGTTAREYFVKSGPGPLLLNDPDSHRMQGEVTFSLPTDVFAAAKASHATAEVRLFGTNFRSVAQRSLGTLRHEPLNDHTRCYPRQLSPSETRVVICESTRLVGDCGELRASDEVLAHMVVSRADCRRPDYEPWPLPVWRDAYFSGVVGQFYFNKPLGSEDAEPTLKTRWKDSLAVVAFAPTVHFINKIEWSLDSAIDASGTRARSRDGVGEAARFARPTGMVTDRRGNLFVVDAEDSVIRKITPTGEVTTFAGMPQQTGAVDGLGRDARFDGPRSIGIDSKDDLFVVDAGSSTIRKITPAGIVSTVSVMGGAGADRKPLRLKNLGEISPGIDGSLYVVADAAKIVEDTGVIQGARTIVRIAVDGTVSTLAGPPAWVENGGK
jgi:hypothetical protein